MRFGTPTGREAYWNPRYQTHSIRPTFGVFVYINHDPRAPNGFAIHTAYPTNGGIMAKSISTPQAFHEYTGYFGESYIRFASDEDFVRFAYQNFMRDQPEYLGDLLDFLQRLMRSNPTEEQLFELLSRDSAAHSHGVSGDMKALFASCSTSARGRRRRAGSMRFWRGRLGEESELRRQPRNDDATKGMSMMSIEMSPGFRAFTGYMIQEHDLFDTMDEWIGFGFANMAWSEAHLLPELGRFLDEILESGAMTDADLEALWTASSADFFILEPDIRRFLTRMRELLDEKLAS